MFGFSGEHILIALVVLLIFGPKNLPKMGSFLGKTLRSFKDGVNGVIEPEYKNLDKDQAKENINNPA